MTITLQLFLSLFPMAALLPFGAPRQEAADLLDAQRAGLGAAAALDALGVVRSRGRFAFEGFPGEGRTLELLAPDGRARLESTLEGMPESLRCTNGELYWMTGTGGVELKAGQAAAADARLFALARHGDWREVYERAELVGLVTLDGRACHELRLVPKAPGALGIEPVPGEEPPPPDTWWLDARSHELVQVAIYATVSGAGWQRLVLDYAEWRTVDGVRFPFRSSLRFGPPDRPLMIRFERESVELDAEVAPGAFQPDEAVFRELAKRRAGDSAHDPVFALGRREATGAATVRLTCREEQAHLELSAILPEVMGFLTREGLAPAGAPFARFHAVGEELQLEAGIPVAGQFEGEGRVTRSELPGGDVVSGMHVGPYRELPRAHEALAAWMEQRELEAEGGPWEVFWTDPGLERDPAKWRTELFQPVTAESAARARAAASADTGATSRVKGPGEPAPPPRDPRLVALGELAVGTWEVEGGDDGPNGTIRFEWLDGGYFLVQHVDLVHGEREIRGIELIGRERPFGEEAPSDELRSRFYDNLGNTLDYTYDFAGRALTIWGGERGSPAAFRGSFSEDGDTLRGAWEWPGGGFGLVGRRVRERAGR